MARTNIVTQHLVITGPYPNPLPPTPGSVAIAWTANTDPTDRSTILTDQKTMVYAWNTDSVDHTITFTSVPDPFNRSGTFPYTVPAGVIAPFGPFALAG